jgi:hypothetical protein
VDKTQEFTCRQCGQLILVREDGENILKCKYRKSVDFSDISCRMFIIAEKTGSR